MDRVELLYREILSSFTDRNFLSSTGISRSKMQERSSDLRDLADLILTHSDNNGRIHAADVLHAGTVCLEEMSLFPQEGWAHHCYFYIRGIIFPHLGLPEGSSEYTRGRITALTLLRAVFTYERSVCRFDPELDIPLLTDSELQSEDCAPEYSRMRRLTRSNFIYEFMRLGTEVTPFNTLGHIAGVHYVATYMAKQLRDAGMLVDVALTSGAAASHDIGKYGCRKSEERRVPYLHYYYTDYCLTENDMPRIAHIAANHSTWDLEFENLSAESLLLIYADFRVKSTRDSDGREVIHFYTLDEAFDVILSKLDNVDEAKKHRYEKVYARLKDFEDYMKELGVTTDMPDAFCLRHGIVTALPEEGMGFRMNTPVRIKREMSLMQGDDIITQLKLKSVGHNIRLMHYFNSKEDFARLIEDARGETNWRNLRTYITILGEYSTYMTENQKALTLRFLYDQLMNRESDVREQSARQMGQITATFRQNYRKELPEDIPQLDETTTNLKMFGTYLDKILSPSSRLTERHRHWIIQSLDFFVAAALSSCARQFIPRYYAVLEKLFDDTDRNERMTMAVLNSALMADPEACTGSFAEKAIKYADAVTGKLSESIDLLALNLKEHLKGDLDGSIRRMRNDLMGLDGTDPRMLTSEERDALLSSMFLDDLKFQTSWTRKAANIRYMKEVAEEAGSNVRLHIAAHFVNLIKVSETVTVRKKAGNALLSLISTMPPDQCNEIMVELFNGLEIEDYQFSRLIPEYLGRVILHLPPEQIDEVTGNLEGNVESGNIKTASASLITASIMLEHFYTYQVEHNKKWRTAMVRRLAGLIMRGVAHYKDAISQEAFRALSERIFLSTEMPMEAKREILTLTGKRILTLIPDSYSEKDAMEFCNNAAALRGIYRFISEYIAEAGPIRMESRKKAAFFPGTFDPFSLGHKAIACTIRNMGYEVYLAIDEFSWSKKTLPHMLRKEILSMSIAAETDMYIFPDDIPVNIANPEDLGNLRRLFADRELYIAVGSDVIMNASSYKIKPVKNSIHTFNHIVFERETRRSDQAAEKAYPVTGKVINLKLKKFYEDISSTRIRENIDLGRDISSLLDPVVQNYIYENNLYIRQPAYKHEIQARDIHISDYEHSNGSEVRTLREELTARGYDYASLMNYIESPGVRTIYIEKTGKNGSHVCAFASGRRVDRRNLLFEFGDTEITQHIRQKANGAIGVIGAFYFGRTRNISNLGQILLTEILTDMLAKDFGYVIYHPADPAGINPATAEVLRRQGFVNISSDHDHPLYAVDMTAPVVIFRDVETVIKAPLNKNPRVMKAVDEAHNNLLKTFCEMYPGKLILSFNTSAVYSKIIEMVAKENRVSVVPDPEKRRGPYMAVPFGKALSDVVVPNTVTKALRTEKFISESVREFSIRETQGYADLDDQVRTLKSFRREVILIDDLLHSGQRMKRIDPILREHDVTVRKVIVGLLTGNARDEMIVSNRAVDGAYFIPSITLWLNERDIYPFIGGDSFESENGNTSINIIMPYTSYSFVGGKDSENVYKYSMTCLENARDIMKVIEQEYQAAFEKQLTLGRLGAVITNPRRPDYGDGLLYDENAAPSVYIESDIKRTRRLYLSK